MARVCLGQITSTASMVDNLLQCQKVVQKAVAGGAKALFLPEASDYIGSSPQNSRELCLSVEQSPFVLGLQEEAKKHSIPISVGIHEPSSSSSSTKIKNSLIWINAHGEITQRYQKVHLFDIDVPGGPIMRESETVEAGNEILPPFASPVGRIGSMICFDLRFPEISLSLKRQGADVLLYPSAFTIPTGNAHWMSLLRARAIETECYVLAAAQVGKHNEKRASYGHSVIISSWGEVLAEATGEEKDAPEVIFGEVDLEQVRKIRERVLPLVRRTDVYPEV